MLKLLKENFKVENNENLSEIQIWLILNEKIHDFFIARNLIESKRISSNLNPLVNVVIFAYSSNVQEMLELWDLSDSFPFIDYHYYWDNVTIIEIINIYSSLILNSAY